GLYFAFLESEGLAASGSAVFFTGMLSFLLDRAAAEGRWQLLDDVYRKICVEPDLQKAAALLLPLRATLAKTSATASASVMQSELPLTLNVEELHIKANDCAHLATTVGLPLLRRERITLASLGASESRSPARLLALWALDGRPRPPEEAVMAAATFFGPATPQDVLAQAAATQLMERWARRPSRLRLAEDAVERLRRIAHPGVRTALACHAFQSALAPKLAELVALVAEAAPARRAAETAALLAAAAGLIDPDDVDDAADEHLGGRGGGIGDAEAAATLARFCSLCEVALGDGVVVLDGAAATELAADLADSLRPPPVLVDPRRYADGCLGRAAAAL
ncbi:hypothetical protein HK405_013222, partial [Cladochytrium tenue]